MGRRRPEEGSVLCHGKKMEEEEEVKVVEEEGSEESEEDEDVEEGGREGPKKQMDSTTLLVGTLSFIAGLVFGGIWREATCDDSSVAYNPLRAYRVLKEIQTSPLLAMLSPLTVNSAGTAATAILGTRGAVAGMTYRGEVTERAKAVLDGAGRRDSRGEGSVKEEKARGRAAPRTRLTLITPKKRVRRSPLRRVLDLGDGDSGPERTPVRCSTFAPRLLGGSSSRLSLYPRGYEQDIPMMPMIDSGPGPEWRRGRSLDDMTVRYKTIRLPIRDEGW